MRLGRVLVSAVGAAVLAGTCTGAHAAAQAGVQRAGTSSHLGSRPAAVSPPQCSTAVASAPALNVRTAYLGVSGNPFGVAATADGDWAFAALNSSVAVLSTTTFEASLVATIPVDGTPEGVALTPDGSYLLVASGSGAIVIDVALAEQGSPNAVVGTLKSAGLGAIQVAFSPDGKFAFVTLEDSDEAAVYNLAKALKQGFGSSDFVGDIPLGPLPVGMAVSPDGSTLYATSEGSDPCLTGGTTCPSGGTLSVINLPEAETDPADSVVSTVDAGCGTVRVITSADGSQVWVTARESDAVLLFSAAALQSNPQNALTSWFRVGEAPVDLTLVNGGTRLLVANSNRFDVQGQQADIGVVKVTAVASAQSPVLGTIGSGLFPREFAVEANGTTALLDNYGSGQVESIDLTSLP